MASLDHKLKVALTGDERRELEAIVRRQSVGAAVQRRARILLVSDVNHPDGRLVDANIAEPIGLSERQVVRIRQRFVRERESQSVVDACERKPRPPASDRRRLDGAAQTMALVCDHVNTHAISSLYHAFDAETAGNLRRRLRLVFAPKNGSWLNMADLELSLLSRQRLGQRRFATATELDAEVAAWTADRNQRRCGTTLRFTTADTRIKLQSRYPQPDVQT